MADLSSFTPGDLVISVYGDGAPGDPTTYADNQASPITLEELTTSGTVVGTLVLPQTASVNASGVTENAISGEYGSSSEGTLQLSADGQSLTIAGYGVNAATYNSAEAGVTGSKAAGGAYGNNALAQTYSVPNGGANGAPAGVTVVPRVIADIRADGSVDTSTALLNVDNENNPRSVVTDDGSSFYLAGQGVSGDTTQGLSYAVDGASSATAINTSTDQRTAEINNGNLYVSTDSKQGAGGSTDNIAAYSGEPTGAATPTVLPGISQAITLSAAQENGINNARVGSTVYLSPENYFFANSTTLYVADGGQPKGGSAGKAGLGDGGLQKWSLSNGSWKLDYTLSAGLNLVANTASSGTTGLIGLTGQVNAATGTVSLFATNSTVGDLDPTYLYGISDNVAATSAPAGESFTQLAAAAPDTNIRGIAFAPAAVCFASGTLIRTTCGDVAVEHLAVGDLVVTADGRTKPVRWLGHRLTCCDRHPAPCKVWPVRVAAGTFGAGLPTADLWLSPGHALCFDGALVPVRGLVDGDRVAQVEQDSVTYWHVEVDGHDVILANGLPAESYLDTGNRRGFDNVEATSLHFDEEPAPGWDGSGTCLPLVESGPRLSAIRARYGLGRPAPAASAAALPNVHLDVDGVAIMPCLAGENELRFFLPAGAGEVRLVSPSRAADGADVRRLGVIVSALAVSDGAGWQAVALDDPGLLAGFHDVERDGTRAWRWTNGEAHLAPALWAGLSGPVLLRLTGQFAGYAQATRNDTEGRAAA